MALCLAGPYPRALQWLGLGLGTVLCLGCKTTQPASKVKDDTAVPTAASFVTRDGVPVPLPGLKDGLSRVVPCSSAGSGLNVECASEDEQARFLKTTAVSFDFHQMQNPKPPAAFSRRDFHPKQHACVAASFKIMDNLPANVAKGIFATPATYSAVMRYSNGSPQVFAPPGTPIHMKADGEPDTRGLAIKLVGVPGDPVLNGEPSAHPGTATLDFLLINFPVFFVRNTDRYDTVLKALATDPNFFKLLDPLEQANLFGGQKVIENVFAERYWSETPARLGDKTAMKFGVRPCDGAPLPTPATPGHDDQNFLRGRAAQILASQDVCLTFMVQPQTDPVKNPIEDAAIDWPEDVAPFVPVATLTLVQNQDINDPARDDFCQSNSFNPWNSIVDHMPMGSINRARLMVYAGISRKRRLENGKPIREPGADDPFFSVLPPPPAATAVPVSN